MQSPPDDVAEPGRRELVLASRDRYRARARQLGVAVEIVRRQRFFDPGDIVLFNAASDGERERDRPLHPRIQHELHTRPDDLSGVGDGSLDLFDGRLR